MLSMITLRCGIWSSTTGGTEQGFGSWGGCAVEGAEQTRLQITASRPSLRIARRAIFTETIYFKVVALQERRPSESGVAHPTSLIGMWDCLAGWLGPHSDNLVSR